MEQRETYVQFVRAALGNQDIDRLERLLEDAAAPFWLRREGLELVMKAENDELAITVFNRLFLPLAKSADGEPSLLLQWWLWHEAKTAAPRRLAYLRKYLFEAASFPDLSDPLYDATLALLATWTQRALPLAVWDKEGVLAGRFLAALAKSAPHRLVDPRMLRAVLWSGDLDLMRAFAEVGVVAAEKPESRLMAHFLLGSLVTYGDITVLRPLVEAMQAKDPRHPAAIYNLAQVYHAECRDVGEIAELFMSIDRDGNSGHFRGAVTWMAQVCYEYGLKDQAATLFGMLPEATPQVAFSGRSWPQKVLQGDQGAAPNPRLTSGGAGLLELAGLSRVLAQPLEQAADLARTDMNWTSPLTAEELQREFRGIVERLAAIPRTATFFHDCYRGAHRMLSLAKAYFEPHRHYFGASPVPLAEKYGRLDVQRLRIAYVGLMSIAAAVAEIGLELILEGAPLRLMEQCLRLLDHFVIASLAADDADDPLPLLERFARVGPCRSFVLRLIERRHLDKGDVAAAEALLTLEERDRSAIYKVVDRETWTRAEGIVWEAVADDPESVGQFDVAWPDGKLAACDHVVPATRLAIARHDALILRRGEILRGRNDLILRPAKFHYAVGYPDRSPDIVARGAGAARLLRLGPPLEIDEPVVVLENFDALYHSNYYHWMVLLLARINYIKDLGLLEGRRFVTPEGLTKWMLASLEAIGIGPDKILRASPGAELRFTDALLICSVEFASPTLLKSLCAKILPPIGADEDDEPVHLYISRRDFTRRPFLNELDIEAMAQDLGFTIVQPEKLTFQEQARLFRRAASVVGPEGAAFANTIFCKPGARTLTMLSENDLYPTFNDIATIMGLAHRKLAGKAELDDYGVTFIWAPYRIDPKLAERELRWALGG